MSKTVWFIRHGESKANAGEITSNTRDIELTEIGRKQTYVLPAIFEDKPDLLVTSPYIRTKQTAFEVIHKFTTCKYPCDLQEWDVQEFTYLCKDKWKDSSRQDREPARTAYWDKMDPDYVDGSGAESFAQFMKRIDVMLRKMYYRTDKFTAIFTHGQYIKALWWILLTGQTDATPKNMKKIYNFFNSVAIPNTGILKVQLMKFGHGPPAIQFDTCHIQDWTY